jgi:hypothetical protein
METAVSFLCSGELKACPVLRQKDIHLAPRTYVLHMFGLKVSMQFSSPSGMLYVPQIYFNIKGTNYESPQ